MALERYKEKPQVSGLTLVGDWAQADDANLKNIIDGAWALDAADFDDTAPSADEININRNLSAVVAEGDPVMLLINGTFQYGVIAAIAGSSPWVYTIDGPPISTTSGHVEGVYLLDTRRLVVQRLHVAGEIDGAAQSTLLQTVGLQRVAHRGVKAYLVKVAAHIEGDPTTTATVLNVTIGGAAAMSTGITLTDNSQWYESANDMDPAEYDAVDGDAIELTTTDPDDGGTDDLSVELYWILDK